MGILNRRLQTTRPYRHKGTTNELEASLQEPTETLMKRLSNVSAYLSVWIGGLHPTVSINVEILIPNTLGEIWQ